VAVPGPLGAPLKIVRSLLAWLISVVTRFIGWSCEWVYHDDPRPGLRARGEPYVYGMLHAHQVAGTMGHGEPRCACILSRSADGDLLAAALRAHRVTPMRGSSKKAGVDKGGHEAMQAVIDWVRNTGAPATITVDGPRGPRNVAKPGCAVIAVRSGAHVVTAILIPKRRWILGGTWDRLQIPKPFTRVDVWFEDLAPDTSIADERDRVAELTARIEASLRAIERRADAGEYAICEEHVRRRLDSAAPSVARS
jgi:lysophospholipid acyltransferase (LPLAT)-like uncharacterized protein